MTARSLRDAITNAFDYLVEAELLLYASDVAFGPGRVGWHGSSSAPFLLESRVVNCEQYLHWLRHGHYSALLFDGALLQLSYGLRHSDVVSHRLAYVPCPVVIDEDLIRSGEPVADVVDMYLDEGKPSAIILRSPLRFDFEPDIATADHPAAHLTVNGPDCRIACVAPLHPYHFLDFVYRHFYRVLWATQRPWFETASTQRIGGRIISEPDTERMHLMWRAH